MQQTKRWIVLAAATVAVAGAAVLVAGLTLPVDVAAQVSPTGAAPLAAAVAPGAEVATRKSGEAGLLLDELQRLCAIELRRPLFDPPPPTAPAIAAVPTTAMTVRLVGTVVEPGFSMAMFQKPDGSIELCALGQSIDDVSGKLTVAKIDGLKVTVIHAGQSIELAVPQTPDRGVEP